MPQDQEPEPVSPLAAAPSPAAALNYPEPASSVAGSDVASLSGELTVVDSLDERQAWRAKSLMPLVDFKEAFPMEPAKLQRCKQFFPSYEKASCQENSCQVTFKGADDKPATMVVKQFPETRTITCTQQYAGGKSPDFSYAAQAVFCAARAAYNNDNTQSHHRYLGPLRFNLRPVVPEAAIAKAIAALLGTTEKGLFQTVKYAGQIWQLGADGKPHVVRVDSGGAQVVQSQQQSDSLGNASAPTFNLSPEPESTTLPPSSSPAPR